MTFLANPVKEMHFITTTLTTNRPPGLDGLTAEYGVTAAMKLTLLLLKRKAMTNLDSMLKSRDIILPTKALIVKAMVFPGVTYRCESWTLKKAEG